MSETPQQLNRDHALSLFTLMPSPKLIHLIKVLLGIDCASAQNVFKVRLFAGMQTAQLCSLCCSCMHMCIKVCMYVCERARMHACTFACWMRKRRTFAVEWCASSTMSSSKFSELKALSLLGLEAVWTVAMTTCLRCREAAGREAACGAGRQPVVQGGCLWCKEPACGAGRQPAAAATSAMSGGDGQLSREGAGNWQWQTVWPW